MELAWVVGGEEVIGVDWSEALLAHASRSFLAAESVCSCGLVVGVPISCWSRGLGLFMLEASIGAL